MKLNLKRIINKISIILFDFDVHLIEKKPYRVSLNVLIERSKNRMIVKPICPFCNRLMWFRVSQISGGGINLPVGSPIRDDIGFKCRHCFHTCHFGIPISKKEAIEELYLRNGNIILRPSLRNDETTKNEVRKRLIALGYTSFDVD